MITTEELMNVLALIDRMDRDQLNETIMVVNEANKRERRRAQAKALSTLEKGKRVVLVGLKPKYLNGQRGEVIDMATTRVTVKLDRPVGKFTRGIVKVPASAVMHEMSYL